MDPLAELLAHKKQLRLDMRRARRALTPQARAAAAERFAAKALRDPRLAHAKRVAFYLAFDGELDPLPLARRLHARGVSLYLPVVVRPRFQQRAARHLEFRLWTPDSRLRKNRYGIPEPKSAPRIAHTHLDVVLVPLTAFDADGGRLGMGAGFYDQTFAGQRFRGSKPHLLGVAYRFQEVIAVPKEAHDLPLAGIWTD